MDVSIWTNILFWIHLSAVAVGGSAVFGMPIVGAKMGSAPPEARPALFAVVKALSRNGRAAILVLLVTGPLIVWLKFGDYSGFNAWFWVKMVLVALLLVVVVGGGINGARMAKGDMAAVKRAPMIGMAGMLFFTLLLLAAVFAFN